MILLSIPKHTTVVIAQAVTPVFIVVCAIMNGFLVARNSIPDVWIWIHYGSYFTYLYRTVVINEFWGQKFVCNANELIPPPNPQLYLAPPNGFGGVQVCPFPSGDAFMSTYDITAAGENEKWNQFLLALIFFFAMYIFAACAIVLVRWYALLPSSTSLSSPLVFSFSASNTDN